MISQGKPTTSIALTNTHLVNEVASSLFRIALSGGAFKAKELLDIRADYATAPRFCPGDQAIIEAGLRDYLATYNHAELLELTPETFAPLIELAARAGMYTALSNLTPSPTHNPRPVFRMSAGESICQEEA